MPIQLVQPIYQTIELVRTDRRYGNEGDATTVTVRQARQHEHEARQAKFSRMERAWNSKENPDDVRLIQDISMEEVWREEAWLTLCDSNLVGPDGNPLFPSTKDTNGQPRLAFKKKDEFIAAWGALFPDIAREIIDAIHEVNPMWAGASGESF